MIDRRSWLYTMGLLAGVAVKPEMMLNVSGSAEDVKLPRKPLDMSEYAHKSMLRVQETMVARSRLPVIDIHTHISWSKHCEKGVCLAAARDYPSPPPKLLAVMDRKNIR